MGFWDPFPPFPTKNQRVLVQGFRNPKEPAFFRGSFLGFPYTLNPKALQGSYLETPWGPEAALLFGPPRAFCFWAPKPRVFGIPRKAMCSKQQQ